MRGRGGLRSAVVTVAASAVLAVTGPAGATHAVDHRYVVLGYVRDERGRPVSDTPVWVVREKTGLSYPAKTDRDGFYVVIVHLHDDDVLNLLKVTTGRVSLRIDARFNPLDPTTPRGTRVDFNGRQATERQPLFAGTLHEFLAR